MALPVPVPDPFFWWTSFSRVKRHWGLFQINLEPLEVQNTNAPPLFPKKVFHHQVLPGPTSYHFPPLKFGTHLGSVEPLTCCYSVRIHEAFAICPNQLGALSEKRLNYFRERMAGMPESQDSARFWVHRCENHGWLLDQTKMNKTSKLLRIHWLFG